MGQEECNDISSFFDFADLYLEADQYSLIRSIISWSDCSQVVLESIGS